MYTQIQHQIAQTSLRLMLLCIFCDLLQPYHAADVNGTIFQVPLLLLCDVGVICMACLGLHVTGTGSRSLVDPLSRPSVPVAADWCLFQLDKLFPCIECGRLQTYTSFQHSISLWAATIGVFVFVSDMCSLWNEVVHFVVNDCH